MKDSTSTQQVSDDDLRFLRYHCEHELQHSSEASPLTNVSASLLIMLVDELTECRAARTEDGRE